MSIILSYYNIHWYLKDNIKFKENNIEKKYLSLAKKYRNKKFPVVEIKRIIDKKIENTKIDNGLIILLSNNSCNPCQLRELKNIKALLDTLKFKISVYSIFVSNYDYIEALRLKKLSNITRNFYYMTNPLLAEFNFLGIYPIIYFIRNQKIISTLIPIPNNESFSNRFYKNIEIILNKN